MKICMTQGLVKQIQISLSVGLCFLLAGLLLPALLQAAPDISARYVQSHGTKLVIEINAGPNPPASAILIQHLPPGIRILTSQPEADNYNENRNRAKWLFRDLRAGRSTVSMTLDHAVTGSDISAEIRFKPAQGKKMSTIQVKK